MKYTIQVVIGFMLTLSCMLETSSAEPIKSPLDIALQAADPSTLSELEHYTVEQRINAYWAVQKLESNKPFLTIKERKNICLFLIWGSPNVTPSPELQESELTAMASCLGHFLGEPSTNSEIAPWASDIGFGLLWLSEQKNDPKLKHRAKEWLHLAAKKGDKTAQFFLEHPPSPLKVNDRQAATPLWIGFESRTGSIYPLFQWNGETFLSVYNQESGLPESFIKALDLKLPHVFYEEPDPDSPYPIPPYLQQEFVPQKVVIDSPLFPFQWINLTDGELFLVNSIGLAVGECWHSWSLIDSLVSSLPAKSIGSSFRAWVPYWLDSTLHRKYVAVDGFLTPISLEKLAPAEESKIIELAKIGMVEAPFKKARMKIAKVPTKNGVYYHVFFEPSHSGWLLPNGSWSKVHNIPVPHEKALHEAPVEYAFQIKDRFFAIQEASDWGSTTITLNELKQEGIRLVATTRMEFCE